MAVYEYQCQKCGEVFEATQRMSDPPLTKHAACGSKKVKKLISRTSFQLKGGGWYVTDYKKQAEPAKTEETKEAKPAEVKAEAKTEKTESKSETKAEAPPAEKKPAKKKKDAA